MPQAYGQTILFGSALQLRPCADGACEGDTLAYDASLKFGHRSENMHLQSTGRIAFACVDSLRRGDERRAVCFKLTNELREML